ncbi:MAG TPA: DUF1634 domain-containing protein [Candidatus Limnocylindrales bacterium]|nr:DUF1634 domain-containing protein [Candidatus Limnocylindrales bacterium]
MTARTMTAERFRTWVSTVLTTGVVLSAALVAIGFAGALFVGWSGSLTGGPPSSADSTDFSNVLAGLSAARPIAIAQAGLLVLLATPVIRVAVSLVAFGLERDRLYAAITAAVLALLLVSIVLVR